jgi:hypothetical protein
MENVNADDRKEGEVKNKPKENKERNYLEHVK